MSKNINTLYRTNSSCNSNFMCNNVKLLGFKSIYCIKRFINKCDVTRAPLIELVQTYPYRYD